MTPGRAACRLLFAISLVVGASLLSPPRDGMALWHNEYPDLASACDDCHTLTPLLLEPNTSLIRAGVRSLPTMKSKNGNAPPAAFGCTFCHYNTGRATYMRDALDHFAGKPSQHPVDRGYSLDVNRNVILTPSTNTTRWLSNWDNSFVKPADQTVCVDCHDVNNPGYSSTTGVQRGYPNHIATDNALRIANPFMLRGGASSWNATDNAASNAFCMTVCHSGAAAGTSGYRMGHYGWGAFDNVTLREPSGNAIKTAKCVDCHETHYSTVKYNLMGERNEGARSSVSQSLNNVDPANCTALCHDSATFVAKGHGKPGINHTCANCHTTSGGHRDPSNVKRLSAAEASAKASLTVKLDTNGRDDNYDGVIDDAGETALQYSIESNCSAGSCHSDKHVHQGTIGSTSGSAGCLHCHDMHGNGVDNNIRMVRGTVMGKQTIYASSTDYYRNDDTSARQSICNNLNCHAKALGNVSAPGTILGDVQAHIDANVSFGTECTSCHNHSNAFGGNSFDPICNSCHTYPGQPFIGGTHVLSPVHDLHAGTDNTGGYAFACNACHYKYTHNQSGVNNAGEWGLLFQSNRVNIKFDGKWNPKNGNGPLYAAVPADNTLADNVYAPGVGGTGVCAGLYCHGNSTTVASWPAGSNVTPAWNTAASGACGTCHKTFANDPPVNFAHRVHADNTTVGYSISCRKCHYETTRDGVTVYSRSAHLNRESKVTYDTTDPLVASGSYSGTLTVGDSGTTTGRCANIYCHSTGMRTAPAFDNGAIVGGPDWKQGALACTACHGASGQTGLAYGMPAYASSPTKYNSHAQHSADKFSCRMCHWTTTTTDNTITNRANHVNGIYTVVNDNLARHAFTYAASACSSAVCHGGFTSGPNLPAWGQGPYGCDACHMNTAGAPAAADVDQFVWDNGMSKINADQWNGVANGSGHGRNSAYPSGNPAAGSRFGTCTANCHSTLTGHDNAVNPFRLRTYGGIANFSDTNKDAAAQQDDNFICLDCHSATGANPTKSTSIVEQNHYGTWSQNKHTASTMGGTFCVDCHDPHGDANHYMIQDNVTLTSDGVYGKPVAVRPTTFSMTNLDGASGLNAVYDWGDYVKSTAPYTGICQTCHAASGGALYFNTSGSGYTAAHNKNGSPPMRCTACHDHGDDFSPSCHTCHGEPTLESGAPPFAPFSAKGNRVWPSTVDNYSILAGLGDHRSRPASGVDNSGHDPFMGTTAGCVECHTALSGSGPTHNQGSDNATMTNVATHAWYNGAAASWSGGTLAGGVAGGSVVDDSCANINCHSPWYGAPANQYKSGTPVPYTRYWINQTLWNCYTCHPYDGRTGNTGSAPRPGGADNVVGTGAHARHIQDNAFLGNACGRCHNTAGYVNTSFTGNHKNGFVDWSFAGSPNPAGYPAVPANAYSVVSGTRPPTDDNTTAGHTAWGSCSGLYCHSIGQKSTGAALTNAAGEYKTPAWDNALSGKCGTCHGGDGVTENPGNWMTTGSHTQHVNTVPYAFGCNICHNGLGRGSAKHVDNLVSLAFGAALPAGTLVTATYSQGLDNAAGNGFGSCSATYCHGTDPAPALQLSNGANQATTNRNRPTWGDNTTGNCGSCHGAPGATTNFSTASPIANWPGGAHVRHVGDNVMGPNPSLACTDCHTAATVSTHVNGRVDFKTAYNDNTVTDKAGTNVCNPCHGSGVLTAKGNWDAATAVDCLTCHGPTAAYSYANATGRIAPNVAGDNSTYGSYARGHNRPTASGAYPVTGNAAANLTCDRCHKYSLQHINNVADNTFAGDRLQDNVNNVTGISTITGLCGACHTTAGASPVQKASSRAINTHGNSGYPAIELLEAVFADRTCDQCHEPHGMVNVSAAPAGVNIWMINPTITVAPGVTASPVRLYAKSGANSFDNTGTSSDLCRACHANAADPGFPMAYNVAGQHVSPGYNRDERGKDCSGCHAHNQDGIIGTVDGLMPLPCNACHGYPGLDNTGANLKQLSAGHWKHVGQPLPVGNGTNNKGYDCSLCHYNYSHNDLGLVKGGVWPGNYYDNVNVNFDTSWNPAATTYRGLAVPTTGNGGTGACAGLYCHGGNASLNQGWAGSTPAPAWNVSLSCGACHDTGTTDTTPGSVYGTKNHPAHLDNVGRPYGPETWGLMGSGGNCSDGTGCHPKYDLAPGGLHANNAKDLRSTTADNGYVAQTLAATQVCRNCHSTYTNAGNNLPASGDTLARTQANWDNAAYQVACITCHNDSLQAPPNPSQGTVRMDGSGNRAPNILAAYYGNGHGASSIDNGSTAATPPIPCMTCHFEQGGHIGGGKIVSNPWRLDNALTKYAQAGGLDNYCMTACHANAAPAKHAWIRVGVGASAKDNTIQQTHPASIPSVPQNGEPSGETLDKSRWFQVTPDTTMPLGGTTASPASGDLNSDPIPARLPAAYGRLVMCVTCHDPHGVGAGPIAPRTFSGQNTDAKGNTMLRFNYSSGVPTVLCAKCHK